MAPEQVQAAALYGSDENCQQAAELGVEVISPTMGVEKSESGSLSAFQFLSSGHVDKCPSGHEPVLRKKKKDRYAQGFQIDECERCLLSSNCAVKKGTKLFYLRYTGKELRIARRSQYEQTEEFRKKYRWRAGVEATMSQYDRLTGAKHLRVRSRKPVRFAAVMKAVAVNIARAVAVSQARRRVQGTDTDRDRGVCRVFRLFKERMDGLFRSITSWAADQPALFEFARNAA